MKLDTLIEGYKRKYKSKNRDSVISKNGVIPFLIFVIFGLFGAYL